MRRATVCFSMYSDMSRRTMAFCYQKMLLLFLRIHRRPFAQPQLFGVDLVLGKGGHDWSIENYLW